jgi:hypothetical protein
MQNKNREMDFLLIIKAASNMIGNQADGIFKIMNKAL